jgi:EAL and modified HD-GYP domain-containing signal transduction protein
MSNDPPTEFLVGLFTLFDALLDQTMHSIAEKLPIGEDIKLAICGDENELKQFLVLIRASESVYWRGIATISKQLSIDVKMPHAFYNQSLKWDITMRQSVSS